MMPIYEKGEPNFWLSVMTIEKDCKTSPEDIIIALENENIESRPVWKPMHMQPVFKGYNFFSHIDNDESISESIFARGICLPSGSAMTEEEQSRVIDIVKNVF